MTSSALDSGHVVLLLTTWEKLLKASPGKPAGGLVDRRRSTSHALDADGLRAVAGYLVEPGSIDPGPIDPCPIDPCPIDPCPSRWRRLPEIRAEIRSWPQRFPLPAQQWRTTAARFLVGTPEEVRDHPAVARSTLSKHSSAVFAATAAHLPRRPAPPPTDRYRYWDLRNVEHSGDVEQALAGGWRPHGTAGSAILARVAGIFEDDAERDRLLGMIRRTPLPEFDTRQPLLDAFRKKADNAACRAWAVATFFRAAKIATHSRAADYLSFFGKDWEHQLGTALEKPAEDETVPLSSVTVAILWVCAQRQWLEQDAPDSVSLTIDVADRLERRITDKKVKQRAARQLAAVMELAFADIDPPTRRPASATRHPDPDPDPDPPSLRLLVDALADVLLAQRNAATAELAPQERAKFGTAPAALAEITRRAGTGPLRVPCPPVPVPEHRRIDDETWLDRLDVQREQRCSHFFPGEQRWLADPEAIHAIAAALRRDTSEDRRARLREFTAILLTRAQARTEAGDERGVRDIFDTVNMLAFDLSAMKDETLENLVVPGLAQLERVAGPFVATVYRSVTIVRSKYHDYDVAEKYLTVARRVAADGPREGTEYHVRSLEARQQVELQATGLHSRRLEAGLSLTPRRRSAGVWAKIERLSKLSLHEATRAYNLLNDITVATDRPLPAVKQRDRAAVAGWAINTRLMFMRALLWRGTIAAVDVDRTSMSRDRHRERSQGEVDAVVDAVPLLYREVTRYGLTRSNLNELTRIALHYSFVKSGACLDPDPAGRDRLPAHLARPGPDGRFDMLAATTYLLDDGHDAGVLTAITYEAVVRALHRRSDSRYGAWLEITKDNQDQLSRKIIPYATARILQRRHQGVRPRS